MSDRARTVLYVASAIVVAAMLMYGGAGLPAFGSFAGPYAAWILRVGTLQRLTENMPTTINFDYRGLDTLGEEFILFAALAGILLIFSELHSRAEVHQEPMESSRARRQSGALRWFATSLVAFVTAMGMDLAVHGVLTPGGGFQGGAVFGSAFALIYFGVGYRAFEKTSRKEVFDALEALGAGAYAAIGVATAFAAGAFLQNSLPLGQVGGLVSGGTIFLINLCVFVEVGAGFVLLLVAFLQQTRRIEESEE